MGSCAFHLNAAGLTHLSFQQSFRFSTNCIGLLSLQLPILPAFSCVLVVLPTCFIVSFSLLDVS